jgi:hypothetical protein
MIDLDKIRRERAAYVPSKTTLLDAHFAHAGAPAIAAVRPSLWWWSFEQQPARLRK